jgi:hypothetical protein
MKTPDKTKVNTSQSKTKKQKDKSWIFILLLFLGVTIVFMSQKPEPSRKAGQIANDPERMKRVDGHLKDTAFNLEADRRQRQIEAYQQLNKFYDTKAEVPNLENQEFSLESDPNMQKLTRELNRSRQKPQDQSTPADIVQQRLYENDQLMKASQAYREAYAQQFIENARKGGWEVELGPNFEVLSVKKLKENRGPSLFNEAQPGGSR